MDQLIQAYRARANSSTFAKLDILELRLEGALALGEFIDLDGVVGVLGSLALDAQLPIDIRYSAFTSLERAGPAAECVTVLRHLSSDEILGPSADSVLSEWQVL